MSELTFEEQQEELRKTRARRLEEAVMPHVQERMRLDAKRDAIHSAVVNGNRHRRNDFSEKVDVPGLPADWREQHWKVKVKLAEDLTGTEIEKTEDKSAVDQAEEILERLEKGSD